MRFSFGNFPRSWDADHDEAVIDVTVQQALLADELGYDAVFFPEHHFTGYAPTGSDVFQIGAYLAPQLRRAWLGFSVVVVPHHHPAHLVEQMNLLDQLAKGRVIFGIGSGVRAEEALGLGVDDTRYQMSEMTSDVLAIAEQLWDKQMADPPLSLQTRYYKTDLFERIVPAPYRKRRPNLMGVAGKAASAQRSARNGWPVFVAQFGGWNNLLGSLNLYRQTLAEAGHDAATVRHCMDWTTYTYEGVFVADTEEAAFAEMMSAMRSHQEFQDRQMPYIRAAEALGGQERPFDPPPSTSPAHYERACLWGTPDQVAAKIAKFAALGIGNMLMVFNVGVDNAERRRSAERSMRLFMREVAPRFADAAPPENPLAIDLSAYRFETQVLAYA